MTRNSEIDYIDLNFKGFSNSVRTTDIKLPPPVPLKNQVLNQKNSLDADTHNQKNNKETTKTNEK